MYPACLIDARVVALMGNTRALFVSLADRLAGNHFSAQTLSAPFIPFHAVISFANLGHVSFYCVARWGSSVFEEPGSGP